DDAVELILAHLFELRVLHDARVIDEGIDAPPFGHDAFDHAADAVLVGDVHAKADGFAPGRLDELHRLLDRLQVDVADSDLGALLGELESRRAPDALSRAGDDGNLARKAHVYV